jgi:hypothetical protein
MRRLPAPADGTDATIEMQASGLFLLASVGRAQTPAYTRFTLLQL